jgi:hypothetical protein
MHSQEVRGPSAKQKHHANNYKRNVSKKQNYKPNKYHTEISNSNYSYKFKA